MIATPLRSRWMWASLAAVGLLALVVVLANAVTGGDDTQMASPGASASASMSAEQQTLLIQVRNDDDLAADNVIVGVEGGLPAVQVLVPSRLVVDPPGSRPQTLAQTAGGLDRSSSQNALRDLLALRVGGTLSLARLALAGMVDFVGGITVDVDTTITTTEPSGQKVVVVPSGTQKLDGTQAAAFALAWLPGEPETARLQRWSKVLTATVSALPEDPLRIEQMLTSLGGSARTTVSTSQVAAFLLRLRAGMLSGSQQVQVLPTLSATTAATGGAAPASAQLGSAAASPKPSANPTAPTVSAPPSVSAAPARTATTSASPSGSPETGVPQLSLVRLDLPASQQLLEQVLPTALLDPDVAKPRILVQDGVGEAGVFAEARSRLTQAGFVVVDGGNATQLDQSTTTIAVGAGSDAAELGADVADSMDVPAAQVRTGAPLVAGADAVVVIGSDFEH